MTEQMNGDMPMSTIDAEEFDEFARALRAISTFNSARPLDQRNGEEWLARLIEGEYLTPDALPNLRAHAQTLVDILDRVLDGHTSSPEVRT